MEKHDQFIVALDGLFDELEGWFPNLKFVRERVEIIEETPGSYLAPQLKIFVDQNNICKIVPVGAHIIAADGRADMIGMQEKRTLVYLSRAYTLSMKTKSKINGQEKEEVSELPLYRGFEGKGWYFVAEGKRSIIKLDKDKFALALEEVSEYKCA